MHINRIKTTQSTTSVFWVTMTAPTHDALILLKGLAGSGDMTVNDEK